MLKPSPSKLFLNEISLIGIFLASLKVKWRSKIGDPKVRVSISSDPAA
jgi:hypothetical protein